MRVESVTTSYRPAESGIRVIEYTTKEANGRHYHSSRTYTIYLYSRDGRLQEYTNKRNIDLSV